MDMDRLGRKNATMQVCGANAERNKREKCGERRARIRFGCVVVKNSVIHEERR